MIRVVLRRWTNWLKLHTLSQLSSVVEQRICNARVGGSSPSAGSNFLFPVRPSRSGTVVPIRHRDRFLEAIPGGCRGGRGFAKFDRYGPCLVLAFLTFAINQIGNRGTKVSSVKQRTGMNPLSKRGLWDGLVIAAITCGIPTEIQAGAAEDAASLMARVFETNKPWLDPQEVQGTYRMWRRANGQYDETNGPFSIDDHATNGWRFCRASRVGSIVWTPLHVMAHNNTPYTLSSTWKTNWNGLDLVAFDVTFCSAATCAIGMGGQANASYSSVSYHTALFARIHIEPTQAVPVYMATSPSPTNDLRLAPTWRFDPFFFQLDGGRAPRSLDWYEPSSLFEHQEFQSVGSVWIFKRGDAWSANDDPSGIAGHIQTLELVDLSLDVSVAMAVNTAASTVTISLPTGDWNGFGLESADQPEGPWRSVASTTSADATRIAVTQHPDKTAQFYRLKK